MHIKAILAICLMVSAAIGATAWKIAKPFGPRASKQLAQLELVQIPEVAITKAEIAPIGPHGTFRFSIRNDSGKPINGVAISIKVEFMGHNGKPSTASAWSIVNREIHPDVDSIHPHNHPISPGEEILVKDEEIALEENIAAVQKITIHIEYIRFVGGSSMGTNEAAGHLITDATIGAEKYKRWLVGKYNAAGRSKQALADMLNAPGLPSELDVPKGGGERAGANIYKMHFQRALREQTVNVDDYLK
jgi:hypothetical protein